MKNSDQLSNEQLISLFRNQNIDTELKKAIITEIDKRKLELPPFQHVQIDVKEKIAILFTSYFLFKRHIERSSQLLSEGNKMAYKQYWRFFIYGILFYTIILFLFTKYLIKPHLF